MTQQQIDIQRRINKLESQPKARINLEVILADWVLMIIGIYFSIQTLIGLATLTQLNAFGYFDPQVTTIATLNLLANATIAVAAFLIRFTLTRRAPYTDYKLIHKEVKQLREQLIGVDQSEIEALRKEELYAEDIF